MKSQRGSAEVVAVAVLVVALAGAVGFIAWNNLNKEDSAKNDQSSQVDNNKASGSTLSSDWFVYESLNKKYSVSIPDGWSLTGSPESEDIVAFESDSIVYKEGTKGTVERTEGGRGDSSVAFYLLYDYKENSGSYLSPDLKEVKSYTADQGVKVTKSTRTQKSRAENMVDIPIGTTEFTYDLYKGSTGVHIVHDILEGETDQTNLIEEMIETFKFL